MKISKTLTRIKMDSSNYFDLNKNQIKIPKE